MDRSRNKTRRDVKGKKLPKVPIETYRWEDVRRARRRGGYPWTHLYKGVVADDFPDPEPFTMDAFRRTRSTSTMGRSDGVDIHEVSADEAAESPAHSEKVTEPEDRPARRARDGSLEIEELGSAASSDDVSQYLDREERTADPPQDEDRVQRAKSEEGGKRKRKLSAESSYSRISLSKLAVMKRLRQAREKIKLPQVKLTKKRNKPDVTKEKKPSLPPPEREEGQPEYIYIPLKPPPGEEAGDKAKPPLKINPAFKQLLKDLKQLKQREERAQRETKFQVDRVTEEEHMLRAAKNDRNNEGNASEVANEDIEREQPPEESEEAKPSEEFKEEKRPEESEEAKPSEEVEKIKPPEEGEEVKPSEEVEEVKPPEESKEAKPLEEIQEVKPTEKGEEAKPSEKLEEVKPPEEAVDLKPPEEVEEIKPPGEPMEEEREESMEEEGASNDAFDRLFEANRSEAPRQTRSKSEEPGEKKRRNSIESAHSRKSLSKLGIVKRLREASEKIKKSFSTSTLKKTSKKEEKVVKSVKREPPKPAADPVYIRIPLKPPEGETDEFSHLEFERPPETTPSDAPQETAESSPSSPPGTEMQFIFLTPPSDDEGLDDKISEIPETPSSDDIKFFGTLKKLAQNAVDEIAHGSKLETVAEESDRGSSNDVVAKVEEVPVVDVEDGLNELKSSLKSDASPALKKKVSFKRKSRANKDDGEYEEVRVPDSSQSMSVDEEKSYLDQKLVKDTSLEEDYTKWSKQSDHEYEPVNPPVEATSPGAVLPTVKIIDTEIDARVVFSVDTVVEPAADEKRTPLFHFHSDEHVDEGTEEAPPAQPPAPGKFQLALRQKTEQLKRKTGQLRAKIQNVKRPEIRKIERPRMPKIPDTVKINLPFKLPRPRSRVPTRQLSTESNAGDSVKRFSFGTFPKFLRRKKEEKGSDFATLPKRKESRDDSWSAGGGSVRVPLHSEDSLDPEELEEDVGAKSSRVRYEPDIDIDDDYRRENKEINMAEHLNRWQHGRFKAEEPVTDLDNLEDEAKQAKDGYSSEGSASVHRGCYVGKIDVDSDEFFVVHEVHEGMRTPANALAQMNEYDPVIPDQAKKKPVKKPKRKKTPHVSREEIPGESMEELPGLPPSRPRRRSKKKANAKPTAEEVVVPYQETIALDVDSPSNPRLAFPRESLGILGDDEADYDLAYENERMQGREQPDITIGEYRYLEEETSQPEAPPRRQKSLKSLTASEDEFIAETMRRYGDESLKDLEESLPRRPERRSRSLASSASRISLPPSSRDEGSILGEACVEEPCVQDFRDYMGYAVVDKQGRRLEQPLPPPRSPTRRRKRHAEGKFATVPRNVGNAQPPVRPLRNYSTLVQVKSSRKEEDLYQNENKENVDVGPYVEIDDDRHLQSGQVLRKMRERPLPAPPRPPRKPRSFRNTLKDITSKENVVPEEESVSTQTDPLPDDFVCEEVPIQQSDRIVEPTLQVKKELITPSRYSYEETVTHGTLLVEPLDGAKILPDSQLSGKVRVVPVTRAESDDDEVSEVPAEFKTFKDPVGEVPQVPSKTLQVSDLDVERLRVSELQAGKIVVSEIEAETVRTGELHRPASPGFVSLEEMGLSPELVKEIVKGLMKLERQSEEEKKTPINPRPEGSPLSPADLREVPIEHLEREEAPAPPPRSHRDEEEPRRPPRLSTRTSSKESSMIEPDVDDEPPPRPPEPLEGRYLPSQPPASFYALRAQKFVADLADNIPMVPRRKRHHHLRARPVSRSRSTSEESSSSPRSRRAPPTQSIGELTGQLAHACSACVNSSIKRLIVHVKKNVLSNADGQQDLHVCMVILLVLIAGLILLGYGDDKTVVHMHHWEYFNPPRDL
ncbi:titin [Cylas formicarius]|uniref:titin n=1 Tax=Cylas formicarius TaxID=197179 RepID=UPI002958B9DC|nr:titin [Cylas formicarius]